jgi:hypothetical protein
MNLRFLATYEGVWHYSPLKYPAMLLLILSVIHKLDIDYHDL